MIGAKRDKEPPSRKGAKEMVGKPYSFLAAWRLLCAHSRERRSDRTRRSPRTRSPMPQLLAPRNFSSCARYSTGPRGRTVKLVRRTNRARHNPKTGGWASRSKRRASHCAHMVHIGLERLAGGRLLGEETQGGARPRWTASARSMNRSVSGPTRPAFDVTRARS
jgi:hypothetical protein